MPNPVFAPPQNPAEGSRPTVSVRLLEAMFGEGYEQVAPDGPNHIKHSYALIWPSLTLTEAKDILAFFEARGGSEIFDYQVPGEDAVAQYRCKDWSKPIQVSGPIYQMTATLVQKFDQVA